MGETYETTGARCPYCQHLNRPDGAYLYNEDLCDFDCESCDRKFNVRVYTSTSWTCTPIFPSKGSGRP